MTEQINLDQNFNRSYEVSVWTLQDSFITVLKWSNVRNKGTIQDSKMSINTDGTQNFSFNIPMSLYIDGKWQDNPIWYNTTNGNLITNMRKLKVIFNKKTPEEEVFEFLITQMEMRHSGGTSICNISCDNGLAYHELGKRGYKIGLSSEVFWEASNEFFKTEEDEEIIINDDVNDGEIEIDDEEITDDTSAYNTDVTDNTDVLEATLDYWCQQMGLERAQTNAEIVDPRKWYYRVEMDWSSYSNNGVTSRDSDKIYEEEYISSWDDNGKARQMESYKEKWRQIDESNSNLYNLTQSVAQAFGVYCRYQYLYDDNYHIIGRLIIFYNNFSNENEGIIQFTYPYTTNEVTRTIDSTDIVTKMYIDAVDDDSALGILSITNTDANRMQEDYLLNFDYLYEIETITQAQYDAIKQYEIDMREANSRIIPLQEKLSALAQEQIDVEAKCTVAKNGSVLASKQLDDLNAQITALSKADGTKDGLISYTIEGPDSAIVIQMEETYLADEDNVPRHYYAINLNTKGIIGDSIVLYKRSPNSFNLNTETTTEEEIQNNQIKNYNLKVSQGEVIGIEKIKFDVADIGVNPLIYLTYDYNPALYYENLINTWTIRKNKYDDEFNQYDDRLFEIEDEMSVKEHQLEIERQNKTSLIADFELMMGPALREGHWTPDNYNDYGDQYAKTLYFPVYNNIEQHFPLSGPTSNYVSAVWDKDPFVDEQKNYYYYGIKQEKIYYPCIKLTDAQYKFILKQYLSEEKNTVHIVFYDYAVNEVEQEQNKDYHWRNIALGAGAQLIFVADGGDLTRITNIKPALIITEAESMSDEEIDYMKTKSFLSNMEFTENNESFSYMPSEERYQLLNWYTDDELNEELHESDATKGNVIQVYPRIWIHTLNLKNPDTEIVIKYNNHVLNNYEDYSILMRENTREELRPSYYYITLNPLSMLLNGYSNDPDEVHAAWNALRRAIDIKYTISNASTAIYLDAIQVHKENAYPKVSYTVSPSIINKKVLRSMYKYLNRIININDNELKLHDAFGYISTLDLDLDHPWQDSITVQNYNNKFEDLFSTITAQTEAMQRREYNITETLSTITTTGEIQSDTLQTTLDNNNLTYSFNNNNLTLTEADGLLAISDDGRVAYRSDGIFTTNIQDGEGNWIWSPAILPSGINANLIKAGQLDTDKIMIYSGNDVKFQWNSEGLYAYRSILDTLKDEYAYRLEHQQDGETPDSIYKEVYGGLKSDIDNSQYVVFNSEGLNLVHKNWNLSELNETDLSSDLKQNIINNGIKQVEVSWDGFKMRNFKNEEIFFADADTGDLRIRGNFSAAGGVIGGWHVDDNSLFSGALLLAGSGENPGILTAETIQNERVSEEHDNVLYYAYEYSYGNDVIVSGTAFHEEISDAGIGQIKETTVGAFNADHYYHYVEVPDSIQPTYTIIKSVPQYSEEGDDREVTGTINTIYVAWTEQDNTESGYNSYESMDAEDDPRIMKILIDNEIVPIIYDLEDPNANQLNATWYSQMQTIINSPPNITINGESLVLSNDIDTYVDTLSIKTWERLILNGESNTPVQVQVNSFIPTFKIEANTGKLTANNGILGNFKLTPDGLSDGVLSNTKLDTTTYITVQTKNGTVDRNMEVLGQCFYKMSLNSSKGIVTLTRLNGDTVNFKTAALKASGTASAAAGKVNTHTLDFNIVDGHITNCGALKSYVKTGSGTQKTKWKDLDTILTSQLYGDKHFYLSLNNTHSDTILNDESNNHYVYLWRRNRAGTWSNIQIRDGGAYDAGFTAGRAQGQSDVSTATMNNGSLSLENISNNTNKLQFTASANIYNLPISIKGTINNVSLSYHSAGKVTCTIDSFSQIISDGGAYDAVQFNNNISWTSVVNHAEQAKLTMSINNTSNGDSRSKTATLSLINDSNDNNIVNLIENNIVRASLTHNKYNLGWNEYYTAMDVNNKKVTIDGIDYYPISELPAIIQ